MDTHRQMDAIASVGFGPADVAFDSEAPACLRNCDGAMFAGRVGAYIVATCQGELIRVTLREWDGERIAGVEFDACEDEVSEMTVTAMQAVVAAWTAL